MNLNHFSSCQALKNTKLGTKHKNWSKTQKLEQTRPSSKRKLDISLRSCLHRVLHTEKAWLSRKRGFLEKMQHPAPAGSQILRRSTP
jgi:hypothetical protein